jgi:phosphate transport system permease protein
LVPWLRENLGWAGFHLGFSWFAGSLVLSLMILPTITSISYDVIATVPRDMRTGSLALGSTRWQTIRHVVLPAAKTGIVTAVVLGMMRAAGEALAVQMVIGNRPVMPTGLADPITTLTSQITLDMGNTASGQTWNQALWTMGLVLLLIAVVFVAFVRRLSRQKSYQ